jgi:SAM-dependent MidA family methyltransferase
MVERGQKRAIDSLDGKALCWYNELSAVGPISNGVIFSNELLDALPFHRVIGSGDGLKEIFVDIDSESGEFVDSPGELSDQALGDYFSALSIELLDGQEAEVSLEALEWIKEAGALLDRGFVISIDYGLPACELYSPEKQGTLLCHYRHTINDAPYKLIGAQDITAHVDFSSVIRAGKETGLELSGFTTQIHYLMGLGIAEELMPAEGTSKETLKAITHNQSIKRLIMPGGMGDTFKVLVQHKGIDRARLKGFSFKDMSNLL